MRNIVHGKDRKDPSDRFISHVFRIPQNRRDPETDLDQDTHDHLHIPEEHGDGGNKICKNASKE